MFHRPTRPLLLSSGAWLALLLPGCGGGGEMEATSPVATNQVRLEACVVDEHYIPNEGVPVRVLSADGRSLGRATSGRSGEVVFRVAADEPAALVVDRPGGERLPLPAPGRDTVVETCLLAPDVA